MWHEKQKDCRLSDQKTSPKKSFGDYVYSKVLPPSGNHVDSFNGLSGKRKVAAIDLTRESNIKEFRSPVGVNEQESKTGVKSFAEQAASSQQFTNNDNNYGSDFLEVWSTNGADSRRNATDTNNGSLCHKEGPSATTMPVGENVIVPTQQARACQSEANISLPFPEACNILFQSKFGNHTKQDNLQQEFCHMKSEYLVSVSNSKQGVLINGSTEDSDKSACSHKTPYEMKQSGLFPNTIGTSIPLHTEDCKPLQNEVQFRVSIDEQSHLKQHKAASPEMKKSKNTSVDDSLSKNGSRRDRLVGDGEKIVQHEGPSKADENIKVSSGKPLITVNDKLWDGRVQLSSSVTVSAVAFFQSGEKLPDTSWSGFVEVKGKVRLEAFEKYVQDLPRSRNRGLMVISLVWKEGSSETEFAGMKEVSNGYKKGEKVGYAQLSPGTDLYICPRSSTIITILAKYGFFKGMSAVEDKQESLIGCVVWRKSQACLNSVTKTLESKCKSSSEQPTSSVSGSLSNQVAGKKSYSTQPGQQTKSTQHVTAVSPSLECAGGIGNEIQKIESSNVHLEIKESSPVKTIPATPLVPSNISVPQVAQKMSIPSHGPCQASSGTQFKVQEYLPAISGVEQSKLNWREKNALISVQYNVKKLCSPTFDEDDLPEYDFGVARGISSAALSKGAGASMLDMKLLARGNSKQDGLVSSTRGTVHTVSAPSQSVDDLTFPTYHSSPYQGKASLEVVCERVCENSPKHNWEEQCSVQNKTTVMPPTAAIVSTESSCTLTKNRFLNDDDDDMPEWCPPEPYRKSLGEANRPSTTTPQKLHNSSFTNISSVIPQPVILPPPPPRPVILPPPPPRPVILPPPPPRPVILPPPPSIHSQFSYQQMHPSFQVPIAFSSNSPRPVPIQSSSSVLSGFNSNSALRPQSSSLDIRPPYQFSGKADWRPRH
ncbi:SPOC domain-containing protein [Heracleum sosnowskyi]|uniref:SPOC domain-containing protein n=1 Tax=Heracleum sosnowskyi TaxID=360622 RepID=A0AAD8JJ80_9APIA|nr:SPOC domain-containing protein [Heracleum sosnowskyi]